MELVKVLRSGVTWRWFSVRLAHLTGGQVSALGESLQREAKARAEQPVIVSDDAAREQAFVTAFGGKR